VNFGFQPRLRRCHPERSEGSWLVRPLTSTAPFDRSLLSNYPFIASPSHEGSAACIVFHFNFRLSTVNLFPLTPFPATHTSPLQIAENTTTLSPAFATLTNRVKHKSFVCHSCKKHPGVGYRPVSVLSRFFPALATHHSSLATIPFRIRTSGKLTRNSRRIRTSKTQDLKPFRIRTYRKTGVGGGRSEVYNSVLCRTSRNNSCFGCVSFLPRSVR